MTHFLLLFHHSTEEKLKKKKWIVPLSFLQHLIDDNKCPPLLFFFLNEIQEGESKRVLHSDLPLQMYRFKDGDVSVSQQELQSLSAPSCGGS